MKVRIKTKLNSNEGIYESISKGEKLDNVIKYDDNDVSVEIDFLNNRMRRITGTYELVFNFLKGKKTVALLNLLDLDQTINMDLYTIDVFNKDGYYYVNYELNNDELFEFEMTYVED